MPTYEQISGTFWRSADGVFCEGHKLALDPEATQVFFGKWATDRKRIYVYASERRGMDPATFVALNNLYAKDASTCFAGPKKIAGADPATFEVLDSGLSRSGAAAMCPNFAGGFARDRANVYHDGNRVPGADPRTFISIFESFGRDEHAVFYEHRKLQGADPRRWRIVAGLFSQDDRRVFFMNKAVAAANAERFYALEPGPPSFAYDGANFFCNGRPSSAEAYADHLAGRCAAQERLIEGFRSGQWQKLRHAASWHDRSPAERPG